MHNQIKYIVIATLLLLSCESRAHYQVQDPQTPVATTAMKPGSTSVIRIALLLDTSNSMDGLIEQAKSQLWEMVNQMIKARYEDEAPGLEIALYEYGNSGLNAREGYIRMVTPLTDDLDQLSADLFSLSTNGGDEFCGQVIKRSLDQLTWTTAGDALQFVFIAGNEPFTQGPVPYKEACHSAKVQKVIVNTIYCGSHEQGIQESWKSGALITGGQYMNIDADSKTVFIASPYDDQIEELNHQLNDTYLPYGLKGAELKNRQQAQDVNAGSYSKANTVKRSVSKSSRFYKNSGWDLVDALEDKTVKLEDLKEEELPVELHGKTRAEQEAVVAEMARLRAEIKAAIQELNKQREYYVKVLQSRQDTDSQLDDAMLAAIKKQAIARGFHFE